MKIKTHLAKAMEYNDGGSKRQVHSSKCSHKKGRDFIIVT